MLWEGKEELENIGVSVTSWVSISLIQQQWCFQGGYLDLLRDITGLSFLSPMPSRNTKAEMALDWSQTEWDRMGAGALWPSTCTWSNVSSSNKLQRNYMGLKIAVCVHLGQITDTSHTKTKNPTATLKSWEQKQCTEHSPCTHHHQMGRQTT